MRRHHNVVWLSGGIRNGCFWHHRFLERSVPFYVENYVDQIGKLQSKEINRGDYDIVVIRDYYLGISLEVDIPIVYITDVTFDQFKDYLNIKDAYYSTLADQTERRLYEEVNAIVFSSEWAANSAKLFYNLNHSKIEIVEFGANIPNVDNWQQYIDISVCNLVFIGVNWTKKGGDKALKTFKILKERGFHCTLTIIGSSPSNMPLNNEGITVIPYLDKSKENDLKRLCEILYNAHFLILPTEFDAFGIVICEASAFGVPSIVADVGGVSQPLRDGDNGFLLPSTSIAQDYANKIESIFSNKEEYFKLRLSSRREYETRLNWNVWSKKVNKVLEQTMSNYKVGGKAQLNDYFIPVYAINLKERLDRRTHLEEQFRGKKEFKLIWIEAVEHRIGAVGLWQSIVKAVETAIRNDDDLMIICEDDHTFTSSYSTEYLLKNIIEADNYGLTSSQEVWEGLAQSSLLPRICIHLIGFGVPNLL